MARRDVLIAVILGVGIAVAGLAYFFVSPSKPALLVLLAVEIAAGREASIPAGLAAGLDWREAALAASFIELTSLFLLFPLLVALAAGLHRVKWLERSLARAQDYARRNPDVDVLALGGLTLMPFLPIGALTSVLIGELLRLPSRYLLPVLATALVLANVMTGFVATHFLALFPDPRIAAAIIAALVLAVALGAWFWHRRARLTRRHRSEARTKTSSQTRRDGEHGDVTENVGKSP